MDTRQEEYEVRRRARLLGLSIDQVLTGIKNIIVHSNVSFWNEADEEKWVEVKDNAEAILLLAMAVERKMSSLADIYASMVPNNPEATTVPKELNNG